MDSEEYHNLPWHHKLAVNVVRSRQVPRHMAYIMDGNRRFAEKNHFEKQSGIAFGFERFVLVMKWSLLLGVEQITVYALSIENFKRPQIELDFIYNLMEIKFQLFIENLDYYLRQGVRFNVIGDISLLPSKCHELITKLTTVTKDCNRIQINIALSYTSREEICSTIKSIVRSVENSEIDVNAVDELFFTKSLYTRDSPEVDLMIRTSGETRLSDFLMWQAASSKLLFIRTLWPEITLLDIIFQIINYQHTVLREQTVHFLDKIDIDYDILSRVQSGVRKLIKQTLVKFKQMFIYHKINLEYRDSQCQYNTKSRHTN